MDILKAVCLAIVEGFTEFLPISSTGHMILVEDYLQLSGGKSFVDTFMVVIQLPAILAVVAYFWHAIWPFGRNTDSRKVILMWCKVVAAFLPAAVLGKLLDDPIEYYLFNPLTVALALIVGGAVLILLERRKHREHILSVHDFGYMTAVGVGFFQCLAMIPGTSRSAATIIGAMLLGGARAAAAEFSFFLAIPTMLGATALKLAKHGLGFTGHQWMLLAVGSVVSFLVAYVVIAGFMRYIQRRSFAVFGYYRIVLGAAVLLLLGLLPMLR